MFAYCALSVIYETKLGAYKYNKQIDYSFSTGFIFWSFEPDIINFLNRYRKLPTLIKTGAVKITPAHDPNDYEIGKRHNLPFITIFDDEGKMLDNCGPFAVRNLFLDLLHCLSYCYLYM